MPYTIQGMNPYIVPEPQQINGLLYVPLPEFIGALDGQMERDHDTNVCLLRIGRWEARILVGDTFATVDEEQIHLDGPLVDVQGALWSPLSLFHSVFGFEITVEGQNVSVVNPAAEPETPDASEMERPTISPTMTAGLSGA